MFQRQNVLASFIKNQQPQGRNSYCMFTKDRAMAYPPAPYNGRDRWHMLGGWESMGEHTGNGRQIIESRIKLINEWINMLMGNWAAHGIHMKPSLVLLWYKKTWHKLLICIWLNLDTGIGAAATFLFLLLYVPSIMLFFYFSYSTREWLIHRYIQDMIQNSR